MPRQLKREGCVAAAIFPQALAVKSNSRRRHYAAEINKHALPAQLAGQLEMTTVDGDELKLLIVEAVPRQPSIGMWNRDSLKVAIVKLWTSGVRGNLIAVEPPMIERENSPLQGMIRDGFGVSH